MKRVSVPAAFESCCDMSFAQAETLLSEDSHFNGWDMQTVKGLGLGF